MLSFQLGYIDTCLLNLTTYFTYRLCICNKPRDYINSNIGKETVNCLCSTELSSYLLRQCISHSIFSIGNMRFTQPENPALYFKGLSCIWPRSHGTSNGKQCLKPVMELLSLTNIPEFQTRWALHPYWFSTLFLHLVNFYTVINWAWW